MPRIYTILGLALGAWMTFLGPFLLATLLK